MLAKQIARRWSKISMPLPPQTVSSSPRKESPMSRNAALAQSYNDIWLLDGVRTPFADYMGPLADISPIDLGIKVIRTPGT